MTDVARWVMELHQPTTEDPGKAAAYLRTIATTDGVDPELGSHGITVDHTAVSAKNDETAVWSTVIT